MGRRREWGPSTQLQPEAPGSVQQQQQLQRQHPVAAPSSSTHLEDEEVAGLDQDVELLQLAVVLLPGHGAVVQLVLQVRASRPASRQGMSRMHARTTSQPPRRSRGGRARGRRQSVGATHVRGEGLRGGGGGRDGPLKVQLLPLGRLKHQLHRALARPAAADVGATAAGAAYWSAGGAPLQLGSTHSHKHARARRRVTAVPTLPLTAGRRRTCPPQSAPRC